MSSHVLSRNIKIFFSVLWMFAPSAALPGRFINTGSRGVSALVASVSSLVCSTEAKYDDNRLSGKTGALVDCLQYSNIYK